MKGVLEKKNKNKMLSQHLDKNNLHHAYLIEGASDKIVPEILEYIQELGIKTSGNPDFCHISVDFLKIKQAFDLREMATEKSFVSGQKIFVLCINRFSPDTQGVLLKMFEEPIENTHFFIVTPDANVLTKTLLSRFYFISSKQSLTKEALEEAEKFIAMPLKNRIEFIKEFVTASEDDDESEIVEESSVRSRTFEFLDAVEYVLHQKIFSEKVSDKVRPSLCESRNLSDLNYFDQIFRVREFLRQQGSPTKTLLESVAIVIPIL